MNLNDLSTPFIIAHRGFKARYPENTIASFSGALDAGAEIIELDVTITKDREIVVIHDKTLERTTDGTGNVREHTLKELKSLDAGAWFSEKFKNERIPLIEEVLKLCKDRAIINIEIKPEAIDSAFVSDSIENQIILKADKYKMIDQVVISSFEKKVIERLSASTRKIPLLAMLSEENLSNEILEFMIHHKVYSYNPDFTTLSEDQVKTLHKHGIKVLTYTVNTEKDAKGCFKMGVDGIFTDDPVMMKRLVHNK